MKNPKSQMRMFSKMEIFHYQNHTHIFFLKYIKLVIKETLFIDRTNSMLAVKASGNVVTKRTLLFISRGRTGTTVIVYKCCINSDFICVNVRFHVTSACGAS